MFTSFISSSEMLRKDKIQHSNTFNEGFEVQICLMSLLYIVNMLLRLINIKDKEVIPQISLTISQIICLNEQSRRPIENILSHIL